MTESNTNLPPQETAPKIDPRSQIYKKLKRRISFLTKERQKLHQEATSTFKQSSHDQVAIWDQEEAEMTIRIRALNTTASVLNPTNPLLRTNNQTMTWLGIGLHPAAISDIQSAGYQLLENPQAVEATKKHLFRSRPNIKINDFTPDHYQINRAWTIPEFPELVLSLIYRSDNGVDWPENRADFAWILSSDQIS